MSVVASAANRALRSACLPQARRFASQQTRLRQVQEAKLYRYLQLNKDTDFGRSHGFSKLATVDDYRRAVPLSLWEAYIPAIDRIMDGASGVLTRDPVVLLEPTSGTSSACKLIPYTAALQSEFMAGVQPWLADLYGRYPALLDGPAYWSVSPVQALLSGTGYRRDSRVAVGFADDAQYFGLLSLLLRRIFPVPKLVKTLDDLRLFRLATITLLLACADLRLISVWNPDYLAILLDFARSEAGAVLDALRLGLGASAETRQLPLALRTGMRPDRAGIVAAALEQDAWPSLVWPDLTVVSCWTQAQSAPAARALAERFPAVRLQGKGLLATEGLVTIPLEAGPSSSAMTRHRAPQPGREADCTRPVLAYRSHFFEFLADNGHTLTAWELEPGMEAEVVLSTGGGLYRYRLGDRVRVRELWGALPVLDFMGRARVSDLCGEKLSEEAVTLLLERVLDGSAGSGAGVCAEPGPSFRILAPLPASAGRRPRYLLLLGGSTSVPTQLLRRWRVDFETGLRANVHYDYALGLGQLDPLCIQWLGPAAHRRWQDFHRRKGMNPGQLKPVSLYTALDIRECFSEEEGVCISP